MLLHAGGSDADIVRKIIKCEIKWPKRADHLSDEARAFIFNMLEVDPRNRYTAEEALNDPWLQIEPPNVHLEEGFEAMKRWNAVRKLRRGMVASLAVSKLEGSLKDMVMAITTPRNLPE